MTKNKLKVDEIDFEIEPLDMSDESLTGLTMKVSACSQGSVISYLNSDGEEIARAGIEINKGAVSAYLVRGLDDPNGNREVDISRYIKKMR